jgi:hypothetical protein
MSANEQHAKRRAALEDLLHLRTTVREATERLSSFGWDSSTDLVTLTPEIARAVAAGVADGRISPNEATAWADAIEAREDVGFPDDSERLLKDFLFSFANPELTEPVDRETAASWAERLRTP